MSGERLLVGFVRADGGRRGEGAEMKKDDRQSRCARAGRRPRERGRAAPPPHRPGGGGEMQVGRRLLSEGQDHHLYLTHLCVFQGRKAVLTFEVCPRTAGRRWRRYSEDDTGGVRRSVVSD